MEFIWYLLGIACYTLALVAVVYPILPGGIFHAAAALLFALGYGFTDIGVVYWVIQAVIAVLLFVIDYAANYYGIQRSGGTKYGIWGSLIGLVVGPFIIPVAGILIGALAGAVIGELIGGQKSWKQLGKIGVGSVGGFIASVVIKGGILLVNAIYIIIILV